MKRSIKRPRRVLLVAESFAVCCPWCGEPQPNHIGSEMWTVEDFTHIQRTQRTCSACDEPILVFADMKANLRPALREKGTRR